MHTTPPTLLERLRQPGDQAAWHRFAQLYTPLLNHWARRTGFGPEEAEDLVQEVFAHLLQEMPRFHYDRDGTFRGWLLTLAVNKWKMIRRRRVLPMADMPADLADPDAADPGALMAEADFQQMLSRRALELMQTDFPGKTWLAAKAVMFDGQTPAQAAAELDMSIGAVHSAVFRVRTRLREELSGLLE